MFSWLLRVAGLSLAFHILFVLFVEVLSTFTLRADLMEIAPPR